jgi:hypothetical protein
MRGFRRSAVPAALAILGTSARGTAATETTVRVLRERPLTSR